MRPPRRRPRAPVIPAIGAGSWPAAGNRFFKMNRPPVIPVGRYNVRATGIPLNPGQASGQVPASGSLTLSVGPQGLGNIWYPAQCTISTTTGLLDTSTAQVYLGSGGVPTELIGSVFSGNGTVAVAIPPMQPGDLIIVTWTGAKTGDTASMNVIGTMDALTTGAR